MHLSYTGRVVPERCVDTLNTKINSFRLAHPPPIPFIRLPQGATHKPKTLTVTKSLATMDTKSATLLFALIIDVGINFGGWAAATALQSEYFYDLLGSISYLSLALGSLCYAGTYYTRQVLVTTLICVWAGRLGSFLFFRVVKTGGDSRFHELKTKPLSFLIAWMVQATWVWICSLPLLLLNSDSVNPDWMWTDGLGIALWAIGFLIESVADFQKFAFKMDPANRGKFVNVGLWRYARYPNYFGEMCLWWGVWLACCATFSGAEWCAVVAPLFVMFILLFVSGVPLQEAQAKSRWANDPQYLQYRDSTSLLVPIPGLGKLLPW